MYCLSYLLILRTVGLYLSTLGIATICKLFAARTTLAECSALVVRNCYAAQLGRVYGPRSCNSNTPTQRSGPNSLIKPLWQLQASFLGKTSFVRVKAIEEEEEYYLLLYPPLIWGHPLLIQAHPFHVLLMFVSRQCFR